MSIATLMNALSKNGILASRPHAEVDLLALKQSYWWSALIWKTIHSHHSPLLSHQFDTKSQFIKTSHLNHWKQQTFDDFDSVHAPRTTIGA